MKAILKTFLKLIVLLLFFNSCTVEKQAYVSDFHVSWNRSKQNFHSIKLAKNNKTKKDIYVEEEKGLNSSEEKNQIPKEIIPCYDQIELITEQQNDDVIQNNLDQEYKSTAIASVEKTNKTKIETKLFRNKSEEKEEIISNQNTKTDSKPEIHGLSLIALILALASIPFLFIFFPISFIISFIAAIFSIISLVKISKNPEKYKGKAIAIIALLFSIFGLLISTIILYAVFLYSIGI